MKHLKLFEHFKEDPAIIYVYAIDGYGNIDKDRLVGTHHHERGFTPNDLGISLGYEEGKTIPDSCKADNGDGDIYYSEDTMGNNDV